MIVQVDPATDFKPIIDALEAKRRASAMEWRELAWKLFAVNQNWRFETRRQIDTKLEEIQSLLQLKSVEEAYQKGIADGLAKAAPYREPDDDPDDDEDDPLDGYRYPR